MMDSHVKSMFDADSKPATNWRRDPLAVCLFSLGYRLAMLHTLVISRRSNSANKLHRFQSLELSLFFRKDRIFRLRQALIFELCCCANNPRRLYITRLLHFSSLMILVFHM